MYAYVRNERDSLTPILSTDAHRFDGRLVLLLLLPLLLLACAASVCRFRAATLSRSRTASSSSCWRSNTQRCASRNRVHCTGFKLQCRGLREVHSQLPTCLLSECHTCCWLNPLLP